MTDKDTCAGATSGSLSKSTGPAIKGKASLMSAGRGKSMLSVPPELCNGSCFSARPGAAGGRARSRGSALAAGWRGQGAAEAGPEDGSSWGSEEQLVSEGVLHS